MLLDGIAYSYDNNGNMVSENHPQNGLTAFAYDFENRLTRVSRSTLAFSTHLNPGWNFFALPGEPVNPNISDVLRNLIPGADFDQVSRFNPVNQSFEHYIANPKFDQFDSLEFGKGYEIYITNPNGVDLSIPSLTHPGDKLVGLNTGWNLIGSPSETSIPIAEALNNLIPDQDYDRLSRWNPALSAYEDSFTSFDSGHAYWLHALRNTPWQISSNTQVYARYVYNGDGQRVVKYAQGEEIHFFHDNNNLLYETNGGGDVTTSYNHTLFIDDLISERKDGQTQFRLNDRLGSLRKMLDTNQTVTASVTYDVFGEAGSIGSTSRFLFTSRELDPETSLYYYRARTYQPSLGRFMSKDPLLFIDGPNLYSYVENNPIKYLDPFGLLGEDQIQEQLKSQFGDELSPAERAEAADFTGDQIGPFDIPGLLAGNEKAFKKLEQKVRKALEKADPKTKKLFDKLEKLQKKKEKRL